MPYYSELGIYTPSSSSYSNTLVKGPYSNHSSILASNILPPSTKHYMRNSFRGFRPHLTTISESGAILPLKRISSPKLLYHSSPKVKTTRPVKINTADIDVSINKYKNYDNAIKPRTEVEVKSLRVESKSPLSNSPNILRVSSPKTEPSKPIDAIPSSKIRRNRKSIRLQTIYKDTVDNEIKDIKSWRDNFTPEELVTEAKVRKKTQGEILKEKFLICNKSKENPFNNNDSPQENLQKLPVQKSTSFKDICNEISSDQYIEDLNPGQPIEVRRRQSRQYSEDIVNEIKRSSTTLSVEDVQLLDALLNADDLLIPDDHLNNNPKSRKKKISRKRSSNKLTLKDKLNESSSSEGNSQKISEDEQPVKRRSTNKKVLNEGLMEIRIPETGTSRLRKDSSLTNLVKDISQVEIEMISNKPKPVITGSVEEIEETVKPNLKAVIEDVEIQESPKLAPKKEKKFRFNVEVEELSVKTKIYVERMKLDDNSKGVVRLANAKLPIVTSILKNNASKQVIRELEEPKILKKKVQVQVEVPHTLLAQSRSENIVQENKNALQKSDSGSSVNYTILTAISKSKDNVVDAEGNKKLKIMAVEKQATKKDNMMWDNKKLESKLPDMKKKPLEVKNSRQRLDNKPLTEKKLDKTLEEGKKSINSFKNRAKKEKCQSNRSSSDKERQILKLEPQKTESLVIICTEEKEVVKHTAKNFNDDSDDNLKVNDKTHEEVKNGSEKQKKKDIEKASKNYEKENVELSLQKDENDNTLDIWDHNKIEDGPPKLGKLKIALSDPKKILKEIQKSHKELAESEEATKKKMMSKRSLIQKANKDDPDLDVFEPPEVEESEKKLVVERKPSWEPLQNNRISQWMHPWKKPQQNSEQLDIYAKPKFIRVRHIPRRWRKEETSEEESEDSDTSEDSDSSEDTSSESEGERNEVEAEREKESKVGASTSSTDSGFHSGRANKGSIDIKDSSCLNPAQNPAFALDTFDLPEEVSQSSTYQNFQKSGRITPPATTIPRFRKYCVDDFNFLKVLGKGSFGKVLLAELKGTEYYYAIKCLKKDVVLEDDDVECTLIERKVLALGTKHPYLCHLLCTFQTESHLFFVMEYLNGGDLMFHIQVERRFSEARARFYGAEIVSGLRFLHNKGIVYRDLKLDNILLDFDGHVRIADFGMCKLQIFLDRMADTFCGTPDYMAPEIIKGQHYNQCADWWSFGVLLYEMLLGQSPFSGCDEDELFWSICNEKPVVPRFLSAEATSALLQFLDKDATKRLGNRFSVYGDIQDHPFFKPIDWAALEARQLEPPFKPNLQHPLDTQYFDKTFTTERAKLTPIENPILQSIDQTQFQGFSYTNPNATDK